MNGSNLQLALIWRPALPPLQILAGAAVLAVLAVAVYRRSMPQRRAAGALLLVMRLAVIAALASLLMGPSTLPPETHAQSRPQLRVLVDTSASMLTADVNNTPRIAYLLSHWLSADQIGRLRQYYDVRLIGFDARLSPLSDQSLRIEPQRLAAGRVSRVAESVRDALLGIAPGTEDAAVLLLSDGHDSDDRPLQTAALLAKSRSVPVHTVCFGGPTLQRDLAMIALPQQEYLMAKEPGQISVHIYQAGLPDAQTTLRLLGGDEIVTRDIAFAGAKSVKLDLPIQRDKPGLYEYVVDVVPVTGETETRNNRQSVFVDVTDKRIRVLVLEGEPFWDTKFLAQSLRKDPRIELTQITQVNASKREKIVTRVEGDAAVDVPTSEAGFAEYDVVIVGGGLEHVLDTKSAALLVKFAAQQGGHVIFSRGRAYDPSTPAGRDIGSALAPLEPVTWDQGLLHDLRLSLTPAGQTTPVFAFANLGPEASDIFDRLPGFTVMPVVAKEKPGAIVLATAASAVQPLQAQTPAIVSMTAGSGKVVAVLGEGLHRWSFLPPDLKQFDGVYDTLWSNLVRWLAMGGDFQPSQQVALKVDRTTVRLGDPVLIDVVSKFTPEAGFHPSLTVTGPDGKAQQIAMRQIGGMSTHMRTTFEPAGVGVYTVALDAPPLRPQHQETKFSVYNIDLERLETSANPGALRALAEQSGGTVFQPDQADQFVDALQRQRAARIVPRQPHFVWDRGLFLSGLLLWVGVEWLARRRAGLL